MAERSESSTYDNILNPSSSTGNVNVHDVAVGSNIITAQPGATVNVNSHGSLREVNSDGTGSTADVRDKLRKWYRRLELPVVSWMKGEDLPLENYFVPLQLSSSRWSSGKADEDYNLEKIFDCDDDDRVSRILIESQAGYGKTTLVHKIMHDWVNQKEYVRPFECTVMIILKHLKGRTVKEAVLDEINMKIENEQVWGIINSDNSLLLLDGLDEISEADRQNVLLTLYDSVGYKMTIIVTCRVGLFKLKDEERCDLFRGTAKSERFWDKAVTILGFNVKSRDTFLKQFVEGENRDEILKKIKILIRPVIKMFKSPLMLILLVYITRENPQYKIKSKTDLFKNLIDCIIKRSVDGKEISKLEKKFTLFDTKPSRDYHDLFFKFGKRSLDHVLCDRLQFECDNFTDMIYRIGFLTKHETKRNFESITYYECFHKTILEFASAFALWNQFKTNENKFSIEMKNKINELNLKSGATSMVIPFLCGLMETDVVKFFIQFADYCTLYSTSEDLMDLILKECALSEELYGAVSKYIPPVCSCYMIPTKPTILTNFNLCQNVVSLIVTFHQLWCLAKERDISVKSLIVILIDDSRLAADTDQCFRNDVKCDNLLVDTTAKIETCEIIATQFKLVLNCISAKYKNVFIHLYHIPLDFLSKIVDRGIFNNHVIDYLHFTFPVNYDIDDNTSEAIGKVIGNITCRQLYFGFNRALDTLCLNNIISTTANLTDITSVHIQNNSGSDLKLDLSSIVKTEKCWNYLGISNFEVVCTHPVIKNNCVKSLSISGNVFSTYTDVLFSLKLTELHCSIGLLQTILHATNFSYWVGFESIAILKLTLDDQIALTEISPCWDKFRNLEFVTLYFCDSVTEKTQSKILEHLNFLKTNRLQLHWEYSTDVWRIVCNVVSGIHNLVEKSKLQLVKNIDFQIVDRCNHGTSASQFDTVVESIISAVKCDSKLSATFVYATSRESMSRPLLSSIDFSNLDVQQIIGEISYLCCAQNILFDYCLPFCYILKLQRKNVA